jgi:hypothetical protein
VGKFKKIVAFLTGLLGNMGNGGEEVDMAFTCLLGNGGANV